MDFTKKSVKMLQWKFWQIC